MQHKPSRRFGQNFLIDSVVIEKILAYLQIKPTDHILEIGAGAGQLTEHLYPHCERLSAIEIDKRLIQPLRAKLDNHCDIIATDILQYDLHQLASEDKKIRIVGNLPYNIATAILLYLQPFYSLIQDMVIMVQKEVALRMVAKPNSKQWCRLSVILQYSATVESLFDIAPHSFFPVPKVQSTLLRLVPRAQPLSLASRTHFEKIVKTCFAKKRKTIANNLKSYIPTTKIMDIGLDPTLRAEQLSIAEFVKLSHALASKI